MGTKFLLLQFLVLLLAQTQGHPNWASKTVPYVNEVQEKVTKLHFYFHDTISGKNPTAIKVAEAPSTKNSSTQFGAVYIIDDPLTEGPDPNSKIVGRAQGLYGHTGNKELAFIMGMSLVFTSDRKLNGSSISVLSHNPATQRVREFSIVGGTGFFRSARGFIDAKTYWVNFTLGDAIVEYTCTVIHY